uniref:Uncharacterized protein n=1 Tax=Oryza punctata TaxID=4537 RepID=A0A0E0LQR5_ORYPU
MALVMVGIHHPQRVRNEVGRRRAGDNDCGKDRCARRRLARSVAVGLFHDKENGCDLAHDDSNDKGW